MTRRVRWVLLALAVVVTIAVLVLDVATGVWQEVPVLSGLASGFVTFLVTVVVVDRVVARHLHEQWRPLTHVALSDLVEAFTSDDERTARRLPVPGEVTDSALLEAVVHERHRLGTVLARWSSFLVSSAGVDDVVEQAASVASALDGVRDAVWAASPPERVREAVAHYDAAAARLLELVGAAHAQVVARSRG